MRLSYSNWQLLLLFTLISGVIVGDLWLHSDLRLNNKIAGHLWSYTRENHGAMPLPSLILNLPITHWQESGEMRFLSNGTAQIEILLKLGSPHETADLHLGIQGSWQVADGFLMFQTNTYSALPLNQAGKVLLAKNAQFLQDIWLALFNRSRKLALLDEQHLLLNAEGNALWLLTKQESTAAPISPINPRFNSD